MTTSYPNITIIQGETYYFPPFEIDGDWAGGICRGQIRNKYLSRNGSILAHFQFEVLTYDPDTDKTTVTPYIDHPYTSLMPPTTWRGTGDPTENNSYVYDIEIEKNGKISKKSPGFVGIIPEVTDNSVVVYPPIVWDGTVDHVELTETNGLVKTYTFWGDADETVNLGTFDVTDGNKGDKGDQGIQGLKGDQGDKGDKGDKGDQGVQGLKGDKGDQGIQGIPGQDASPIETIHIHLSDKETPVIPATDVEWFFLDYNLTITSIRVFSLREAPVGSSIIIRVRNEATNLFTNLNTLTIPVGQTSAGPFVPDNAYHAEGSILWFDIQQVGSSSTGLDYRIILQGTRS